MGRHGGVVPNTNKVASYLGARQWLEWSADSHAETSPLGGKRDLLAEGVADCAVLDACAVDRACVLAACACPANVIGVALASPTAVLLCPDSVSHGDSAGQGRCSGSAIHGFGRRRRRSRHD